MLKKKTCVYDSLIFLSSIFFILTSLKDFWKNFRIIPLLLEVYFTLFCTEHAAYNRIT